MEKKKTSLLMIGAIAIVLSIAGVTYAFWQLKLVQTNDNTITSSCFEVTLEKEGESITLDKAYPISDTDGEKLEPYTFTITNKCDANASYQINLESLTKYNDTTIGGDIRLKSEYVKAKLNEVKENVEQSGDIVKLTSSIGTSPTLTTGDTIAYEAFKLATGYLNQRNLKILL